MKPLLIAYATTEGHTRRIAEFMTERIEGAGHEVDLVDTATPEAALLTPIYVGAIVGGSVHQGHHQSSLEHFVKDNASWLNAIPIAAFSVSLCAATGDEDDDAEAQRLLDDFVDECGLTAGLKGCFAGALLYSKYDFFKRFVMRLIARREGGATDTSQDYVYTDWDEVGRFVDEFLAGIE
ncbi:MAG: flavodoxin domain-containing protein [Gammaproteobacteria bacterium]